MLSTARTLVSRPAALVIPPNPCAAEAAPVPPNGCRPLSLTAVPAVAVRVLLHNGVGESTFFPDGSRLPLSPAQTVRWVFVLILFGVSGVGWQTVAFGPCA